MRGMEKISEAILDKVRAEAQDIIRDAEVKARERVERAKKQQEARFEEEKNRLIQEAKEEAARVLAQTSLKARQELLLARTGVIDEIINRVRKTLSEIPPDESAPLDLIREAVRTLDVDKAIIYVPAKGISAVKKLVAQDKKLAKSIEEVKECDCTGGVIAEDTEGKMRIDNTYETRLEMLLPRLLPEIGKELFGGL
jgi:V/A-type H+-transporting ATPase subunit E